ncbi:zinc uptake protein ZrgA [Vibrio sinaloensis]|uniref:zinc uptake protein ZrgA n=1 Tax=Photobacterium sp. (strain ATCC 43367) TaxID=379097 RepID=UPI0035ED3D00
MYKLTPIAALIALTVSHAATAEEGFRQHDAHVHGEVELNIAQDGKELLIEITAPGADVVGFEHAPQNDEQKQTLAQAVKTLDSANLVFSLTQTAGCKITHHSVTHTLAEDHDDHGHDEHKHDDHHDHDHDEHKHDDHHDHDHDEHKHDDHHDHDHDKHKHDDHHDHDHDEHKHDDHHDHDHDEHKHDDHHDHDHEGHSGHGEFTVEYHFQCDNIAKLEAIDTSWFKLFPATEALKVNVLTDNKQEALRLKKGETTISL